MNIVHLKQCEFASKHKGEIVEEEEEGLLLFAQLIL